MIWHQIRTVGVVILLVLNVGMMFWISLQLNRPQELAQEVALIAVMVITMGAVIAASFSTALIHSSIGPPGSEAETGLVFRESIKRYAWVAAPIASGYGLAQIVRTVAEIIVQTP